MTSVLVLVAGPLDFSYRFNPKKTKQRLYEKLPWSLVAHNVHFLIVYIPRAAA